MTRKIPNIYKGFYWDSDTKQLYRWDELMSLYAERKNEVDQDFIEEVMDWSKSTKSYESQTFYGSTISTTCLQDGTVIKHMNDGSLETTEPIERMSLEDLIRAYNLWHGTSHGE
tara:strand:- start:2558 stop:2899 length:342 start_codon:yes stop_codon:yes gene_type:complete